MQMSGEAGSNEYKHINVPATEYLIGTMGRYWRFPESGIVGMFGSNLLDYLINISQVKSGDGLVANPLSYREVYETLLYLIKSRHLSKEGLI